MGNIAKDINTTFETNKLKAFLNIKFTASWINTKEVEFFKPYGISPQQYNILRILRGAAEKTKVQIVKDRMVDRAPNVTRLMDKLLDKHLIERFRCDNDRRVVFVNITEQGLMLLAELDKFIKDFDLVEKLTEDEAGLLSDLLDKIR